MKFKFIDRFYLLFILCPEIKILDTFKLYEIVSLKYLKFFLGGLVLLVLCLASSARIELTSSTNLIDTSTSLKYLLNSYPFFNACRAFQLFLCVCVFVRYSRYDQNTKIRIFKILNKCGLIITVFSLVAYMTYVLTGFDNICVYAHDSLPRIKFPFVGEPGPSSIYSALLILSAYKANQKNFIPIFAIFQLLTLSMTGMILALVALWMLWSRLKTAFLAILCIVFLIAVNGSYIHYAYLGKPLNVLSYNPEYSSVGGRSSSIPLAMQMVKEHPVFGVGFENWRFIRNQYAEKIGFEKVDFYDTPSSSLIQFIAEFGLFGFFVLIIGALKAYKLTFKNQIFKCFSVTLFFSMLASSNISFQIYWILLGLFSEKKL
jgi:O-antigen ligase